MFTSTNVDTATYIFLDDVLAQSSADLPPFVAAAVWGHDKEDVDTIHDDPDWEMDPDIVNSPNFAATIKNDLKAIPSISVVMDWADLFGSGTLPGSNVLQGIYLQGKSDERPMSLEYFTADGASQFQIDAAIEMQGHSSTTRWNSDKMSFQVKFKAPYGPNDLDAVLFGGTADGANATTEFDTLILDAGYNYSWIHQNPVQHSVARYVTDQVVSDLQNLAGGRAPHGKYVHLYLNGMYWGLYNVHERPDDSFAEAYFGGDKDDYDVIKHNPAPDYTWAEGGVTALNNYQALLAATQADMNVPANYQAVEAILDVDDFIDYMIVHYYAANNDWSHNNWYATHNRVEPGAKWHFHAWDQEHAFPTNDNGDSFDANYDATAKDDPSSPTGIHRDLMANPEYKLRFADRVQKLMQNGGPLTASVAAAVYEARANEIDRAIVGESARWGDNRAFTDPFTRADWRTITDNLVANFFPQRTTNVLGHFAARGWLQSLTAPAFNHYGGEVSSGFEVTISKPIGSPAPAEVYFTIDGSDPRLTGGAVNPVAQHASGPITIAIDAAKQIKARIKNGAEWSPLIDATFVLPEPFPVRITEIHYHPADHIGVADEDDLEFIELFNTGNSTVSMTGLQIAQFATNPIVFGSGIELAAGARMIVARNPAVFESVYGPGLNVYPVGYTTANLSNSGERIVLLGPLGETLQDFTYDDIAPWPAAADGAGPSLEIINALGDPSDPANWRASVAMGGSPGTDGQQPNPIPGDYDRNGAVELADYNHWRASFGLSITPGSGADGNNDGTVDAADYIVWRKNLGAPQPPGAGTGAVAAFTLEGDAEQLLSNIASQIFIEPVPAPKSESVPLPNAAHAGNMRAIYPTLHSVSRIHVSSSIAFRGDALSAPVPNRSDHTSALLVLSELVTSAEERRAPTLDHRERLDAAEKERTNGHDAVWEDHDWLSGIRLRRLE